MIDSLEASNRFNEANKKLVKAQAASYKAEAVCAGLSILKMAETWPGIEGFYFTSEQEYDDQNYYTQTRIELEINRDAEGHEDALNEYGDPEDDYDTREGWSEGGLYELFSNTENTLSLNDLTARVNELAGVSGITSSEDV